MLHRIEISRLFRLSVFLFVMTGLGPLQTATASEAGFDWLELKNPIYERENWSVKDACMIRKGERIYLFFSAFFFNRGQERSHISAVWTEDFKTFSDPLFIWDGEAEGWTGMCSPDISLIDGRYILSYNSWGDQHPNGRKNQLFYAASEDLETWDKHLPLASNVTTGIRAIDAALTKVEDRYLLVWKENQTPQVAVSESLDGKWKRIGTPTGGWFENAQFIVLNSRHHMLVTGAGHQPSLMKLKDQKGSDEAWLDWEPPQLLSMPQESFNTHDRANAAFLADWREHDDYFYLLYAGSTEGESHAGRGDNRLGLARSKDLIHWSAAGDLAVGTEDASASGL